MRKMNEMDKMDQTERLERRIAFTRRHLLQAVGAGAALHAMGASTAEEKPAKEPAMDEAIKIPAWYYQHFDADYSLPVPEASFGGWKKETLDISRKHTAIVSMHAWTAGTKEEYPGWWRVVPYIPRSYGVLREVYPRLLSGVRASGLPLFHVVGSGDYYKGLPGHKRTMEIAGPEPPPVEKVKEDPIRERLMQFRNGHAFPGTHNVDDIKRGFKQLDFPEAARPKDNECIAENGRQLFALCKANDINHLIYCGFAINWCLLMSPGGMMDMMQYGVMCSAFRQATTAVENKESAPTQAEKENALWRVSLEFGLVFDVDDFIQAVKA